jgi:hypothetical protein
LAAAKTGEEAAKVKQEAAKAGKEAAKVKQEGTVNLLEAGALELGGLEAGAALH